MVGQGLGMRGVSGPRRMLGFDRERGWGQGILTSLVCSLSWVLQGALCSESRRAKRNFSLNPGCLD
jgi:hypothetical protein